MTSTAQQTLASFLLDRIAEDEAEARVFGASNETGHEHGADWEIAASPEYRTVYVSPNRVLAECEAKRRIVRWYLSLGELVGDNERLEPRQNELLHVLHALALPYADHPAYRDEWRP